MYKKMKGVKFLWRQDAARVLTWRRQARTDQHQARRGSTHFGRLSGPAAFPHVTTPFLLHPFTLQHLLDMNGLLGSDIWWLGGTKNTNFQNSMGALSNPISFAIRISKQFLDPGKVIFGHFIDFGHFPIEIPIEAEKFLGRAFQLS